MAVPTIQEHIVRRTSLFLAKTGTLFGVPAIALAQSKTPGTPTIPTGPAVAIEASQLSGTITASTPLGSLKFTLTPTKWETASAPKSPTCTASSSTTTSKSGTTTSNQSATLSYSCSLGSISKNTTYSISGISTGSWSGEDSAYPLNISSIDLSTLPSTASTTSKVLGGTNTLRSYTQNLTITKSGFSFDEKVKMTVLCAEQIAGVAFNTNIPAPISTYTNSQTGSGATTHYASTSTYPELAVAYYTSGWQFAVAGPRPGAVKFRTPESAKSALSSKTVTSTAIGKSGATSTSTVVSDDLSKGWYDLAPLETVNSSYCKAW